MTAQDLQRRMESRFGSFISVGQVAEFLGCYRGTARTLLQGLEFIGGRTHRYDTKDVAKRIVERSKVC